MPTPAEPTSATFRCANCSRTAPQSERVHYGLLFKLATLGLALMPFAPSFIVWPTAVCRRCEHQVTLTALAFCALLAFGAIAVLPDLFAR